MEGDKFTENISEDDITLSQFMNTLENEFELKDIDVNEVFSEFCDPGPGACFPSDQFVDFGSFHLGPGLGDLDFLSDFPWFSVDDKLAKVAGDSNPLVQVGI